MELRLFRRYILLLFSVLLLLPFLMACTKNGDVVSIDDEKPVPVAFDTYLQNAKASDQTRATYPTAPQAVGEADIDTLKKTGFGVFAMYTGSDAYNYD